MRNAHVYEKFAKAIQRAAFVLHGRQLTPEDAEAYHKAVNALDDVITHKTLTANTEQSRKGIEQVSE